MRKIVYALAFIFISSCASKKAVTQSPASPSGKSKVINSVVSGPKPVNVIIMIGDGMGLSQISALDYLDTKRNAFDRFPTVGLLKTSSSAQLITDSAAGATVYSTGVRTYNGAIGVSQDTVAIETILEQLAKQDYKTGLVATSSITHATPASFYAHQKLRSMEEEIANDLLNSDVDYFAGGGLAFFTQRKDKRDLVKEFQDKGYEMDTTSYQNISDSPNKKGILLAPKGMPKMLEGRGDFLETVSMKGIEYLSSSGNPFFMLIEGSQIDWGGHANDGPYLATELQDFNETINAVLDWAEKDGNTIVIVTADHECGGFSLSSKSVFGKSDYNIIDYAFTTTGHTGTMVPIYSYGPKHDLFNGTFKNTAVYSKLMQILEQP